MNYQNLIKQIEKLALKAVLEGEGSHSVHENLATGPKYQKIEVEGASYDAFRDESRYKFLRQIPHANARVLDIGSNFGVTSRYIASLGASEVVGFEYDPYFIAVANLVNISKKVKNVRFVEGDATRSAELARLGVFDIVYALSSFNYAQYTIGTIAENCLDYFVVETHLATPGVFRKYYEQIGRYFSAYKILGFTDHGRGSDGKRLFIVFARSKQDLERFTAYDDHYKHIQAELNLEKSHFTYLKSFFARNTQGTTPTILSNDKDRGIMGAYYWEMLIRGYSYWIDSKHWRENPYYKYLQWLHKNDLPGGSILNTRADHEYILNRRLETFHRARTYPPKYPIKLRVKEKSRGSGTHYLRNYGLYQIADNDGIQASFDGIHRCFMYKYLGYEFIPADVTMIP